MIRSSKDLKAIARDRIAGHYGTLIIALLLYSLIPSLLTTIFSSILTFNSIKSYIIYYVAQILISLLASILAVGYTKMTMDMIRKKGVFGNNLFFGYKNHADRYVGAAFTSLILTGIPSIPLLLLEEHLMSGGTLFDNNTLLLLAVLCVIGLIITLIVSLMYAFVYQIMIDHPEMSVIDAYRSSRKLMKGSKFRLFKIYLSFIPLMLLSILTLFIGLLWIYPFMQAVITTLYFDLTKELD